MWAVWMLAHDGFVCSFVPSVWRAMIAYQKKAKQTTKSRLSGAEMKHNGPALALPQACGVRRFQRAHVQLVLGRLT